MSAVISRPSPSEYERVMSAIEQQIEIHQPMTIGQMRACLPETEVVVNTALDRLMTAERVSRRVIAGRIVYFLPDWTPPKPGHRKPEALGGTEQPEAVIVPRAATAALTATDIQVLRDSVAEPVKAVVIPPPESVSVRPLTLRRQRVVDVLAAQAEPLSSADIAGLLGLERMAATTVLKELRDAGLVQTCGLKSGTRWFLTVAGSELASAPSKNAATESHPGLAPPAAQPIDAGSSTAAPAARDTYTAVTEPAGPRDGLSSSADPALNATLDWHAASAEREAQRRNAAPVADFALPDAMSNAGEWEPEAISEPGATSVLVDDAKFALWSDGRLEIDAGDTHLTLTVAVTRQLFTFLDHVCAIDHH
ncbi:hypothetical protein [Nevskia ramosa]|uniref:hypothetical protein n=1 Tax=Nevskia ramosa TaxID=64002 RepID=UPI002356AB4C|nr:hypothetical protein [Nevskia ramosa]